MNSYSMILRNKSLGIVFLRNKQSKLRQLFNVAALSAVIKSEEEGGTAHPH